MANALIPTTAIVLCLVTGSAGANCAAVIERLAADDLWQALALQSACKPGEPLYRFATARIHLAEGSVARAAEELSAAIRHDESNAGYHWWLSHAYLEQSARAGMFAQIGLAKKAAVELQRAAALDPANITVRLELIDYYASAPRMLGGDPEKAAEQVRDIGLRNRFHGMLAKARLALAQQDMKTAENDYHLLVERFPDREEAALASGFFHLGAARWSMAMADFRHARSLARRSRVADYGLGATLARAGDAGAAEAPLRRYLAHIVRPGEPTHAHAFYHLALVHKAFDNKTEAIADLEAALRLDPGYGDARRLLADMRK